MVNFLLIAVCMIAGMLFRHSKTLPGDTHKGINAWIIYIALPAISFKYLPSIKWDKDLIAAIVGPILVWLGGWLFVIIYKRLRGIDNFTAGGLRLVSGLSNTSFVGFPLISAYFGEKYLSIAIICDQVTFLLLSTAGIVVAINSSKKQPLSASVVIKKVLTFPPFLGCLGALVIPHFINIDQAKPLFDKLAGTVGPLALFSIGLQLRFEGWRRELEAICTTLLYKLILAPAAVSLIFFLLAFKGIIPRITVFEAAMPTLLTSGVVADEYGLNPRVSNLIIGIGILVSLVTTGLWYLILR
jgi:predicted permease